MKRTVNIKQQKANCFYSAEVVKQILGISNKKLAALESIGKLQRSGMDGTIPGYPQEQVEALRHSKRRNTNGRTS